MKLDTKDAIKLVTVNEKGFNIWVIILMLIILFPVGVIMAFFPKRTVYVVEVITVDGIVTKEMTEKQYNSTMYLNRLMIQSKDYSH